MDPYKVLNLEPNATIEEVNRAYFYIAKMYHPNKGGNEAEFLKFQNAYRQIVHSHSSGKRIVAPKDFLALRDNRQPIDVQGHFTPNDFKNSTSERFNAELFNRKFQQEQQNPSQPESSYTYNIEQLNGVTDRCAEDYKREYARVTAEAENITPFGNGRFNNQTFNHAFQYMKDRHKEQSGDVEEYGEPAPVTSREIVSCTDLEDPSTPSSGDYTNFNMAYQQSHTNPENYTSEFLARFQGKGDITRESKLSNDELKKRVNNWHSSKLTYNKEKLITDHTALLQEVEGLASAKSNLQMQRQSDLLRAQTQIGGGKQTLENNFQRMLALRQPYVEPLQNSLMLERPVTTSYNRDIGHIPLQLPPTNQGQPPPIYRKHKKKQPDDSLETELRLMKKAMRKQQRTLRELTKKLETK